MLHFPAAGRLQCINFWLRLRCNCCNCNCALWWQSVVGRVIIQPTKKNNCTQATIRLSLNNLASPKASINWNIIINVRLPPSPTHHSLLLEPSTYMHWQSVLRNSAICLMHFYDIDAQLPIYVESEFEFTKKEFKLNGFFVISRVASLVNGIKNPQLVYLNCAAFKCA